MAVQPINNARDIVVGNPVLARGGLDHIGFHAPLRRVVGILLAHGLKLLRGRLVKRAVLIDQRQRVPGVGEADGFVQHIGSQQSPVKLPGIPVQKIVKGKRIAGEFVLPPRLGLAADAPHCRSIGKQVGLGAELLVGPVQIVDRLLAVGLGRLGRLKQPAGIPLARLGLDLAHQPGRRTVMDQTDGPRAGQIAAGRDRAVGFDQGTVPPWHMREVGG